MTQSNQFPADARYSRAEWAALRPRTPLTLSDADLAVLRGVNGAVALDEVADVHLPLTRPLNLHFAIARGLSQVQGIGLGLPARK